MSARYCKHCGTQIETIYGQAIYTCPDCKQSLELKDLMSEWTFKARVDQLKAMHSLMQNANDEGIYMSWIYLMPDGATEDDFKYIALSDEQYNECFDLFIKLVAKSSVRW